MNEQRARVLLQEKGMYKISNGTATKTATVSGKYRHEVQTLSDYPAVGDYVTARWPEDDSRAVITGLFPRKSCFIRKAAGAEGQEQVVAANIHTVFICMSLNRDFNLRRLERYLAVAYNSGAEPVVVLTKADLCKNAREKMAEVEQTAPGTAVVAVSVPGNDFAAIMPYILPGKTVAFMGSSGVGKSTLINSLTKENRLATRQTGSNDKGRHTTTHRELIELPNGAFVIDTPGMRELGMWDSDSGIDAAFADLEALACGCKYNNCTHTAEPGCAVLAAIAAGALNISRLEAYRKLKAENAYAADSSRYLAAKREKFKKIAKMNQFNKKK